MTVSRIGGLEFSTDESARLTIATLDGWYSGAPVRSEVENRPNGDGAFGVNRVYKGARVITQTGLIVAETMADPLWMQFAGIQANGAPSEFEVFDEIPGWLTISVTLADAPTVGPLVGGVASYVLQLVARDPIKYGPEMVASTGLPSAGGGLEYPLGDPAGALYYGAIGDLGRVTLTNSGTADVWPVFVVSGFLDAGFEIRCIDMGSVIRYDRVVPAGTTVTVDSRTGSVLIDGVSDGSTYLTRDEFFPVPAGGSCEVQFSAVGVGDANAVLTATVRPGWW